MSETETLRHRLEQWMKTCALSNDPDRPDPYQLCHPSLLRDALQRITDLEAQVSALTAQVEQLKAKLPKPPKPLDHYWTPDPTNSYCVKCGDNGLGSPWGVHRFQIHPGDPDFVAPPGDPVSPAPHQE